MGDEKGTKKPKKPKPPKLPGKPPPKEDKAATEKYNALVEFIDCKGNSVALKAGKLDWLGLDVAPPASFEADPNKPGTINIKVDLGIGAVTLPASVKDGKLEVDTSGLPVGADKVKKFVDDLNNWFESNGKKIDGATIKDGSLTITKANVAPPPGKAGEKKEEKGVKGGLFPNVPAPEKVGAAVLLGASVLFGIGFMNAGDETETTTQQVCPAPSGPGDAIRTGIDCPPRESTAPSSAPTSSAPPPRSEGLAEQIGDVIISGGGEQSSGTITNRTADGFSLELPLFAIGENHRVDLRDAQGNVVDTFSFTVPAASGPMPTITTQQSGTADCTTNHARPVPPGPSGEFCFYIEPAVTPAPTPTPQPEPTPQTQGQTVEPVDRTTEQKTDGAPVSLAVIPGAILLVGGALYARDTCRGEKKYNDEYDDYDEDDGPPAGFAPF